MAEAASFVFGFVGPGGGGCFQLDFSELSKLLDTPRLLLFCASFFLFQLMIDLHTLTHVHTHARTRTNTRTT